MKLSLPRVAKFVSRRVFVLAGGDSPERDVSLRSGAAVCAALAKAGHRVTPCDPAQQPLGTLTPSQCDVAFIALHGGAGEDGRVQRQLDAQGIAYTGSSAAASALAMSKRASKERFQSAGVPTPEM